MCRQNKTVPASSKPNILTENNLLTEYSDSCCYKQNMSKLSHRQRKQTNSATIKIISFFPILFSYNKYSVFW